MQEMYSPGISRPFQFMHALSDRWRIMAIFAAYNYNAPSLNRRKIRFNSLKIGFCLEQTTMNLDFFNAKKVISCRWPPSWTETFPKKLGTRFFERYRANIPAHNDTTSMEGSEETDETRRPVKLETVVLNSLRHSFQTLDEVKSGRVAKSQLQVLCASICLDVGTSYDAQHLADFKSPSTTLNCQDFLEYIQDHLLLKGGLDNFRDRKR